MKKLLSIAILSFLFSGSLFAQELIEWRGAGRSGIYPETKLLKSWPEKGPELILEINDAGTGYSTPVIYNQKIYITGRKDTMDCISAYQTDGQKLWELPYGRAWSRTYPETRCTPTIENNRIYLLSGMGEVCCVDALSGKQIWKVDAHEKYQGESHTWGIAESLVISGRAVFYVTGGELTSVVALDKETGKEVWKTKSLGGTRAYASSKLIEKNGLKLLLAQTANDLMAVNVENGEIIWTYNLIQHHPGRMGKGANTNTPLVYDDEIFITSGYDHAAIMLSIAPDGRSVSLKWSNPEFDNHMGGVVRIGDYIYGSNWINNSNGNWIAVNWQTGKTAFETNWYNKGPIIAADGMLYCLDEKSGNLALVNPNPEKLEVISSFRIEKGSGPYWAHPSIYDGKLLVRHGEYLAVYKLRN